MSTTSSSGNANVKRFVSENRKKSENVCFLGKSTSMKEINNKLIYQAMIVKMYKKNKSRNENLKNKRSVYSVDSINGNNINNVSYIKSNSARDSCSFHIPNFAKILLNQKQNDFSYIKNNKKNYRNSVNVNKMKQTKSFVEINEESLSYTNKTTRLKNENRTNKKCISLKRKIINEKSNSISLLATNSRNMTNVTRSKSATKNVTSMRKRASSSINISETSKEFDTEGPEEFHFMLVDVLSKQKQAMIKLSYQLHIKNEGVDVNYLD